MCFLGVCTLLWPHWASAQLQPHRAEYALRLGSAINAVRIGTAVQDITLDCDGWHLERDIKGEVALTASWSMNVASKLDSQEQRSGPALLYHTLQSQNGTERETRGKVLRDGDELRAEIVSPAGPTRRVLPTPTLMPVALVEHLVEWLRVGKKSFQAAVFDAEGIGDAFLVDVTEVEPGALRKSRPVDKPVVVPGRSWPVSMGFMRRDQKDKPLFTLTAQLFDSGVLDRLTADSPIVTVTADLQALDMHKPPACAQHP
jgi:hypothetical protein